MSKYLRYFKLSFQEPYSILNDHFGRMSLSTTVIQAAAENESSDDDNFNHVREARPTINCDNYADDIDVERIKMAVV